MLGISLTEAALPHDRDWYFASHAPEVLAVWPGDELEAIGDFAETSAEGADSEKLGVTGHGTLRTPEAFNPVCHHVGSMHASREPRWSKQNTHKIMLGAKEPCSRPENYGMKEALGTSFQLISRSLASPTAVLVASACHSIAISVHAIFVDGSGAVFAHASAANAFTRYLSDRLGISKLPDLMAGAFHSQSPLTAMVNTAMTNRARNAR